jgi:hypothetical protein
MGSADANTFPYSSFGTRVKLLQFGEDAGPHPAYHQKDTQLRISGKKLESKHWSCLLSSQMSY